MKIYNFAVEVYDSPGAGIGRWRSCGQQEWELISHEVILQLLFFPPLIHLTVVTQPYSWLFVYATRSVCLLWGVWGGEKAGPLFVRKPKKKRKRKCAMEEPSAPMPSPVRAMLMWLHLCCYMCVKMRNHHHTPGWWDYFQEIT